MRHILPESSGPAGSENARDRGTSPRPLEKQSSSLPFGRSISFSAISGPTYVTAQILVQQTAYALSDKLFTYSPDNFDLDTAVRLWSSQETLNAYGSTTGVYPMQIRVGAGSIALGYMFSDDFDHKIKHIPQSLIGSTSSLRYLRTALSQPSLSHITARPVVAHIAAVDYAGSVLGSLVTDYSSALEIVQDLDLGLVCSISAHESQHMALFSTLLSSILPTVHIYDGVTAGRETTRVIDVFDKSGLYHAYTSISEEFFGRETVYRDAERKVGGLLRAFNGELGTAYELFEYQGHQSPEHILVVFGTIESSLSAYTTIHLAKSGERTGVLNVRVYRPFSEEEFIKALPISLRSIVVLGQVHDKQGVDDENVHSSLYDDVLTAVTFSQKWRVLPSVAEVKYARNYVWTPKSMYALLYGLARRPASKSLLGAELDPPTMEIPHIPDTMVTQQYIFWDTYDSLSVDAPSNIARSLACDSSSNVIIRTVHNDLIRGGVKRTDIRNSKRSIDFPYSIEDADVVYVGELDLLKDLDVLSSAKDGGVLLAKVIEVKDEDVKKKLPVAHKKNLLARNIRLYVIDIRDSELGNGETSHQTSLTELAFLKLARPDLFKGDLKRLAPVFGDLNSSAKAVDSMNDAIREIKLTEVAEPTEKSEEESRLPKNITATSFVETEKMTSQPPSILQTWHAVAKSLAFKEVYTTKSALRPDLAVKTWTVHVKESRRLTPIAYDRNIFHVEFDLGGSGLKYEIGEALGIHGENDETEVKEFIKFYGLEPEEVVEVSSREDPDVLETRTVYQCLMQNIDIFGRPPKKFYEALAEFAEDDKEKRMLLTLASIEGATEFKRRAEVDTVTYADILLEFPSAHPAFHDIARIVSPMKRREYSIASSQQVTPNSVSLLVVTVGWTDPKGRDRFGQATRYLAKLQVGDAVTVSVKPSVMKLPPKATQPLIMAGLGTGLAPFRAFVQYRAWQKSQGMAIGSVLLYMGSRHQREEYLYGEEWEAYQAAGVITLLGRAFSRDQPQKIYIQDRMRQTVSDIIQAYIKDTGSFYLCGPTWPVPDVTEVLQEAIQLEAKAEGKKIDARKEIDRLKDDLRYVLEGKDHAMRCLGTRLTVI